ncbi:MAG: HK97 family phage prohead protease [Brevundimonas sp.]
MSHQHGLTLTLDTKNVTDEGVFEGYASRFNTIDQGRDIVLPGAFAKSLQQYPAAKVKMLLQHDRTQPIGVWTEMKEDEQGLYATGRLLLGTTAGRDVHEFMKAGALDGLSIGYRSIKDRYDRTKSARLLEEVVLREVSVVTFPMHPDTTVSRVKNLSHDPERARQLVREIHAATAALRA